MPNITPVINPIPIEAKQTAKGAPVGMSLFVYVKRSVVPLLTLAE